MVFCRIAMLMISIASRIQLNKQPLIPMALKTFLFTAGLVNSFNDIFFEKPA